MLNIVAADSEKKSEPIAEGLDLKEVTNRDFLRGTKSLAGDKRFFTPTFWLWIAATTVIVSNMIFAILTDGHYFILNVGIGVLGYYLYYTAAHEAAHSTHQSEWVNKGIGYGVSVLFMYPYSNYRAHHLHHHAYTNHETKDPDFWALKSMPLLRCLTQLNYYFYWTARYGSTREKKTTLIYLPIFFAYIALVVWSGLLIPWLASQLLPVVFGLSLLSFTLSYLPHQGKDKVPLTRPFEQTRMRIGKLEQFLLIQHNFHLIHHLNASIPFYNYAKAWRATEMMLRKTKMEIVE